MVEKQLDRKKHTSGEAPKVCSVCNIAWLQAMFSDVMAVATGRRR